jgi:hypothetical protein
MKKRNTEDTAKARKAQKEICVVRSWFRQIMPRSDHLTLCSLGSPCALCVSLGMIKPKVER